MEQPRRNIISWCTIAHGTVRRNGKIIYRQPGGSLNHFLGSLYQHTGADYPKFYKMDQLCKLGWLASEVLLKGEGASLAHPPEQIGLLLTNANSSLDTDLKYFATVKESPSPALFVYTLPNILLGEICIRNGFKGENACFILPRFDAGFLQGYAGQWLDEGILKVCICGWVDTLEENYDAALFLVTSGAMPEHDLLPFTKENLETIVNGMHQNM